MWHSNEQILFRQANEHNSRLKFDKALAVTDELLERVIGDGRKYAYVLGCRQAIALRHLGRHQEAEEAFTFASQIAGAANDPVILAYILNDWSSMREGHEAIQMVETAIELLTHASSSPDPERILEADLAYFKAVLAHHLEVSDPHKARELLYEAATILKSYARDDYPRYNQAYLIVLLWSISIAPATSPLGLLKYAGRLGSTAIEAMRQGKFDIAIKKMRQR